MFKYTQGKTSSSYLLYTALIWSAKNFALQPCLVICAALNSQIQALKLNNTKQDIYLKNVILALSWVIMIMHNVVFLDKNCPFSLIFFLK